MRLPILLVSFAFIAVYFTLQSQAAVLQSMASPVCASGSPAAIQTQPGPSQTGDAQVVEIVTGWHRFDVGADQVRDPELCSTPAGTGDPAALPYDAETTARTWLWTDLFAFAPAYGVLLALIVIWARTQVPRRPPAEPQPAEWPILRAASWLSRKPWVLVAVLVGVLADVVENVLLLVRFGSWFKTLDAGLQLAVDDLGLWPVHLAGLVKWAALILPLFVAFVFAVRKAVSAIVLIGRAARVLWLQLALVAVFVGMVAVPDQAADAVRRLAAWQWAITLALLAVLVFAVLLTATGALKPRTASAPTRGGGGGPPRSPPERGDGGGVSVAADRSVVTTWWPGLVLIGIGAAVIGVGLLSGRYGLCVLGAVVAVVGMVTVFIDAIARPGGEARRLLLQADADNFAGQAMGPPQRVAVAARPVGVCLAAVPMAALGVATIRATAGDLALLGPGGNSERLARLIVGIALTIVAGWSVLWLVRLRDKVARSSRRARLTVLAVLVALLGIGLTMHSPGINLVLADKIGALGLVMIFLAGLALIPTIAAWLSYWLMSFPKWRPVVLPSAVRILRVRSTPVLGLLVTWAVLVGVVDYASYHDVRRLRDGAASATGLTIDEVARAWWSRGSEGTTQRPALVVASSGGGIRAGYWTAAVLDCLIERNGPADDPCRAKDPIEPAVLAARRRSLLAMSGISGGSLGLAAYVAAVGDQWSGSADIKQLPVEWYDERLGADFLAPTVAAWLFNDGVNALLRPRQGVDRAAVMERAWEATWDGNELDAGFLEGQRAGQPLLLLNGFSVEDGCRLNSSVLVTDSSGDPTSCGAVTDDATRVLRSTADLTGLLCDGQDLRISTAVLTSARFPYISPAGRLQACRRDGDTRAVLPDIEVVDGGYRETSGASTIVELWPRLADAVDAEGGQRCVRPIFLQIDNGYTAADVSTSGQDVVSQFTAPITAFFAASGGQESGARQASYELFEPTGWHRITTSAHPGSSAPLGWVLSSDAAADLQRQLTHPATEQAIVALRAQLDEPPTNCS